MAFERNAVVAFLFSPRTKHGLQQAQIQGLFEAVSDWREVAQHGGLLEWWVLSLDTASPVDFII